MERMISAKIYAATFRAADHLRRLLAEARAIVHAALATPARQPATAPGTNSKESS